MTPHPLHLSYSNESSGRKSADVAAYLPITATASETALIARIAVGEGVVIRELGAVRTETYWPFFFFLSARLVLRPIWRGEDMSVR